MDQQDSTYSEAQHFNNELGARMALQLGEQVHAGIAAGLRLEFAERKLAAANHELKVIAQEVQGLREHCQDLDRECRRNAAALAAVAPKSLPQWYVDGEEAPEGQTEAGEPEAGE